MVYSWKVWIICATWALEGPISWINFLVLKNPHRVRLFFFFEIDESPEIVYKLLLVYAIFWWAGLQQQWTENSEPIDPRKVRNCCSDIVNIPTTGLTPYLDFRTLNCITVIWMIMALTPNQNSNRKILNPTYLQLEPNCRLWVLIGFSFLFIHS